MDFNGKYIYKITNVKNGKIYIGQSINPKKRFDSHMVKRVKSKIDNMDFYKDVMRYSKKDFKLEVLGFYEDYNYMEEYFIKKFNTIENGYNVNSFAMSPPVLKGENSPISKLSEDDVLYIKNKLKENMFSSDIIKELAEKFNVYDSTIYRINEGIIWHDEKEDYPIKKNGEQISEIIKKEILKGVKNLKEISILLKVNHSRVKAINSGQNYKDERYKYPLRANLDYNKAVSTISFGE